MSDFDDLIADLQKKRDELRVQIHLGSKEAKEEFERLEQKMEAFMSKAADEAKQELEHAGKEIKAGFDKLWATLKG